MRFLLYNIRYGIGGRPGRGPFGFLRTTGRHFDRILEFIQSEKPDITGLIEVDLGSYRMLRRNQAQEVACALGHGHTCRTKYGHTTLVNRLPVFRRQGNAIIAPGVSHEARFHYFAKGFKRLVIELETPDLVVFLVHLSLGTRIRTRQLADLYDLVKQTRKPHIVAGDFNTLWGEHEIRLFLAATGLANANAAARPSFPSWAPKRHLDFILHSPGIRIRNFRMPPIQLSDHLPLICDFDLA